uniref:Uncharacterized protein n=1 Tax=Kryptolebias marmoratus TaxID=37003 RepID=A0A3Q3EF81_KRYMA
TASKQILKNDDIQKVSLDGKPETVEELKTKIKEKCKLQYDFSPMYEDPDFDNALCNLDDIGDLPATIATVKVIPLTSISDASCASDDTEILSSHSSTSSCIYETKHTGIHQKIIEWLQSVALALISKHLCLREPGSPDGCSGWKHSLKFKMGNYRCKLKKAGGIEVAINAGKGGGQQMTFKGLKRHKRYDYLLVNYLPDIPEPQSEESLEAERNLLVEEMKKRKPSGAVFASKMDQTFPLRRREIVEAGPPVKMLKEQWPALFTERQVFAEYNRIVTNSLQVDFFEALDRYTPCFVKIFKAKKGSVEQTLTELVQQTDAEVSL